MSYQIIDEKQIDLFKQPLIGVSGKQINLIVNYSKWLLEN